MSSLQTLLACALQAALATQSARVDSPAPSSLLEPRIERYSTDRRDVERFWDLEGTSAREARLAALEEHALAELAALDFAALPRDAQVDWLLQRTRIERDRARRTRAAERRERFASELGPTAAILALEEARWTLTPVDLPATSAALQDWGSAFEELAKRARAKAPAEGAEAPADALQPLAVGAADALFVAERVGEARDALRRWYEHGAAYDPGFAWWSERPRTRLDAALGDYAKALREDVAKLKGGDDDPLVGDPIGREALIEELGFEWIPYTPEELLQIGERELAWCERELVRASNELGFGDDWKAALEHVKGLYAAPGRQDELVQEQANAAIAFLAEHDLVTVPELCAATWRVRMLSPDEQKTLPFAAYGGQVMLVASPTADMDQAAKLEVLRGNNEHFTRAVTPHELIPGHHLQAFQSARLATYRQAFRTPFFVEGWAVHWELVEWELGWPRGSEDRIGMLFWRAHRAARILVSLGFHLGQMSPEEMIDVLVERVGHERDNATAEVRRYVGPAYGPLYQCGYLIGALQIHALRRELVGAGGWSERRFHDAVLAQNAIPIELVRAGLTGEVLQAGMRPAWRFDGGR